MKGAAQAFSRILTDNNVEHAFIGGFALNLLGSNRETLDIDVEVAMDDANPEEFRGHLTQLLRSIPILHPSVLVLTKLKRSSQYIGSTRPQSVVKLYSDVRDIVYLLHWLQDHYMKIDFINYDSVTPERLYDAVRNMRAHWVSMGENDQVKMLDDVLQESDKAIVMNN
ncbi:uncharacterized protein FPRO_15542 [Fusarium proliferatum ET1]|uniref:Uncharacterized protein n=1 Tax=Fusarium proliferatum (strain ET1) TaxID=1227346 RepID=A0A1L7VXX4_FUSPR|nr:uncharacterized protein FPRO_15542 [Fusarium proliferatum ET1]CZR45283.1 uncharacterized protein FPRO_15542 [Fusarium proliferatum ET1]